MKKLIVLILTIVLTQNLDAHNPAMASYYLFQQEDGWQLRTEFAWSLRNALIKSFPYLSEEGIEDSDYTDCVLDYLDINLEIKIDGTEMEYGEIMQIPGTHSHSFVFLLDLSGPKNGNHLEIHNECLTELYRKQKNHMIIKTREESYDRFFTRNMRSHSFQMS